MLLQHIGFTKPLYVATTTAGLAAPEFFILGLMRFGMIKVHRYWDIDLGHLYYPLPGIQQASLADNLVPIIAISVVGIAYVGRISAGFFDHACQQDYIRTAHSKGLIHRRVVSKHALKNVVVDLLDAIPGLFGLLLASTMVVEHLYGYPGLASRFIERARHCDVNYLTPVAALFTLAYVSVGSASSWLQKALDHRRKEAVRDI